MAFEHQDLQPCSQHFPDPVDWPACSRVCSCLLSCSLEKGCPFLSVGLQLSFCTGNDRNMAKLKLDLGVFSWSHPYWGSNANETEAAQCEGFPKNCQDEGFAFEQGGHILWGAMAQDAHLEHPRTIPRNCEARKFPFEI